MDIMELYNKARNQYAKIGVDTDSAIEELTKLSLSIDCNLGGCATNNDNHVDNVNKLKDDISEALGLIPGMHRINLSAKCYITDDMISIDELESKYFDDWITWGKTKVRGIDLTSSMDNHEMADTGFTLSSDDKGIRYFWIDHAMCCRKIGEKFGREMISPCYVNIKIHDKQKFSTASITKRQQTLTKSLDKIYSDRIDDYYVTDIISGSESNDTKVFTVASELLCHQYSRKQFTVPQVTINPNKDHCDIHTMVSNACYFSNSIAVNVAAPMQGNILMIDENISSQIDYLVRNDLLDSTQIFVNIHLNKENRKKQWVISTRAVQRALLRALLTPQEVLDKCDEYMRAALLEEFKSYPLGAVWDYFCTVNDVPAGIDYLENLK